MRKHHPRLGITRSAGVASLQQPKRPPGQSVGFGQLGETFTKYTL